ncbi:hypothetical protein [Bartonella sp. HY761]|uniref:hypothetical protein n=1 Tax=Bartonella sp. HY761 TaxID=2979330 RepID=UPI00220F3D90|nr:hypothetical protein [Bartonella sp. HY761]UXN07510.1 hypothetical protein N6A79_05870 [Bartonella sp. HY761]
MKFSLVFEAIDKASKTFDAIAKAQKGINSETAKGAEKSAKALEKTAKAQGKNAEAANKAAKATQAATKSEKAQAAASAQTERLIGQRTKGWRAEADALTKLNKVTERWIRLQANKVGRAGVQIGTGLGNISKGAMGAAKYGAVLGGAALAGGGMALGAAIKGSKQAREYQQLTNQMRGVTASAEEAAKAMQWVEKAQMPPHGIKDLAASFILMKNSGIDPTKGALQNMADMAVATNKPLEQATKAYTDAMRGELGGLKEFGITAQKNGKYIEYMFAGKDGRMKMYKAKDGNKAANAAALQKIMEARFGGQSAAFGKTWDGMLWKISNTWDRVTLKIMNAGVFDFLTQKLDLIVSLIDKWAADGTLDEWCQKISDNMINMMTIAWAVIERLWAAGNKIFGVLDNIAGYVGGWENLAMVLITLPLAPALMRMSLGFFQVGQGIVGMVRFGGTAVGLFSKLNGVSKLGAVLRMVLIPIGLVTKGFISMGIAFMTTPLGWVVAAIAAIAAGAYLIYRNWDKIGPWFKKIWTKTKQIFAEFWNWVKSLFTWDNIFTAINWFSYLSPIRWIEFIPGFPGWDTVISWFSWDSVLKALNWLSYLSPLRWIKFIPGFPGWDTVISWFSWDNVLSALDWLAYLNPLNWGDWIPTVDWSGILQSDTIQTGMDKIVGIFEGAKGKIKSVFDTVGKAWGFVKGLFSGGEDAAAVNVVAQDPAAIAAATAEVDKLSQKLQALSAIEFGGVNAGLNQLQSKTAETIAKAGNIANAFESALKNAGSSLSRANFESHGAALMRTFAQGIKNGANSAIQATRDVVGQIRDYLPHSPAKVGPLSDLDRVRFSETLATAMRPEPAIKAAERIAKSVRGTLDGNMIGGVSSALSAPTSGALSSGLPSGNSSGGGALSVNFAPIINVAGSADEKTLKDVMAQVMRELEGKLPKLLDKAAAAKERKAY